MTALARPARFEIVRTDGDQPWHARYRAQNGRVVWTTENYARRRGAVGAIQALTVGLVTKGVDGRRRVRVAGSKVLEVRDVDERTEAQR